MSHKETVDTYENHLLTVAGEGYDTFAHLIDSLEGFRAEINGAGYEIKGADDTGVTVSPWDVEADKPYGERFHIAWPNVRRIHVY